MIESVAGGCLCGAVRYEARAVPETAYLCHCRSCQRAHSAPYAALVIVDPRNVRLTAGSPARYEQTSESGNVSYREFCARCGSQLFSGTVGYPQFQSIKVMTFDDPDLVQPDRHVWVEDAVGWVCMRDGLPRTERQQPTEAFVNELDEPS